MRVLKLTINGIIISIHHWISFRSKGAAVDNEVLAAAGFDEIAHRLLVEGLIDRLNAVGVIICLFWI